MKKICIVTTMWSSINNWIKPFLNEYHENNIDVTIVCNMDEKFREELAQEYPFVHSYPISFPRGMSIVRSLESILSLCLFFRKNKFDLVQYSTPNAAFYSSVAARFNHIPVRLYCQWGMVFVTQSGIRRFILKLIERITCHYSTHIQPDSIGNLTFCRNEGFYNESKSCVIWNGSAKGIDLDVFDNRQKETFALEIKEKYGIDSEDIVIGFVGRLGKEKGCNELLTAFRNVKKQYPKAKLLFVGPIEKEDTMDKSLLDYFWNCEDIIKTDRVQHVEKYISAMDVFVLPSYREGFGMSVIEASAMCVPVIVTKYPGPASAMVDGKTGIAVSVGSAREIEAAITKLLENPELAIEMGKSGKAFVEQSFDRKVFIRKYMENRLELLGIR